MEKIVVTDPKQILWKIVQTHTRGETAVMLVSIYPMAGWIVWDALNGRIEFSWGIKYFIDIGGIIGDYQEKVYMRPKSIKVFKSFREFIHGDYNEPLSDSDPEEHTLIKTMFGATE